ncbi:DegT/DnrJ/EryC1/StrS family aminotransferase [Desulfobacula sp.]|uniref:DegT/DnrJ/EryC1/StrS family aminotransferase n=1 Tax=Candidatus Desulfatibia vada TaxID=2841696 RepID=A0A8J6P8G3_9BACT|nr:DegT/DnrJ/EryC1/StrS family aminotransferase [Candidatus Desulfatibia vada]MBL6995905.1 DegT/DnrJ/EryC1/StrS family aminotransferase [Desulfobacula sp.]
MINKLSVPVGDFHLGSAEKNAILEVLENGKISEGVMTSRFEDSFKKYIGTKYCIATSSGTSALQLIFLIMKNHSKFRQKIEKRKYIITNPVNYIATANAITLSGYEPFFVDINKKDFSLKIEEVEDAVTSLGKENVAALLPVHVLGYPNDMNRLRKIADENDILLIEDSAEAHGTIFNGKRTGSLSSAGIFSFYIAHNIQAGEMGCIVTDEKEIYKLARSLKANGRICDCNICTRSKGVCPHYEDNSSLGDFDPRFYHHLIGLNFKTMEFQSALALTQMEKVDYIFSARQDNVKYLNEKLVKFNDVMFLPLYSKDVSYLAYPLVLKDNFPFERHEFRKKLEDCGIENRPIFGCIPTQQPAYSFLREKYKGKLKNAEYVGSKGLYLGCHQYLNLEQLDHIVNVLEYLLDGVI